MSNDHPRRSMTLSLSSGAAARRFPVARHRRLAPAADTAPRRAAVGSAQRAPQRLVALSLIADGCMHPSEVDLLCRPSIPGKLFASDAQFFAALAELCADLRRMPVAGGCYAVSRQYVERLLAEVSEPEQRRATLNLMFDVIRSDGRLAAGEAALLWNALDAWGLRLGHLGRAAVRA
jgi:hypothetical protein